MDFFRKLKTGNKHKQLKSTHMPEDDSVSVDSYIPSKWDAPDNETYRLDSCSTFAPLKENDNQLTTTHLVKYLGCISIERTPTKKHIAKAIKIVKSNRTNRQAQRDVNINVMAIEVEVIYIDTSEIILNLSIYNVSNCTVQDKIFALVAAEKCPNLDEEIPLCYVFQCPNRKVAEETAQSVNRSFGYAYQQWRQQDVDKKKSRTFGRLKEIVEDNDTTRNSDANNSECKNNSGGWVLFDDS